MDKQDEFDRQNDRSVPGSAADDTRVFENPEPGDHKNKVRRFLDDAQYVLSGDEEPRKKRVRKKTRRWGCLGGALYFLLLICTAALAAIVIWQGASDVLGIGEAEAENTIEILETDDLDTVSRKLKDCGMVKYPRLFTLFGKYTHAMEKIRPGTYTLSTLYDYQALVRNMRTYDTHDGVVDVTIPEGYTVEQIFTLLDEKGVCTKDDLNTIASDYDFGFDFLSDIEYGTPRRLEGYLFPDTYQFYLEDDPVSVIKKLLSNFDTRFTDEMRAMVADTGYTMQEIVTIASIIEKEAGVKTDRVLISSVIYNRLASSFNYLQIDATVIYALGGNVEELSYEDLEYDDPYNTYVYPGLTPGPISNPGLDSIKAALEPADTNYYYYALKEDGSHKFSETFEEHQRFLNQGE